MIDRRTNLDRRTELTPRHDQYLDEVAEIAVDNGQSEDEFVKGITKGIMQLRQEEVRAAYRIAKAVNRMFKAYPYMFKELISAAAADGSTPESVPTDNPPTTIGSGVLQEVSK